MTPTVSAPNFRKPAPFIPVNLTFQVPAEVNATLVTERTWHLPTGSHQFFLPRNFYGLPPYASFRPTSAITLDVPATKAIPASLSIPTVKTDNTQRSRKTLRTVSILFNVEGRLAGAKIDLSTGEVVAHDYKDYFERGPKARRKQDAPEIEPFWMKFVEGTNGTETEAAADATKKRGRPPTVHTNSLQSYVVGFGAPGFALAGLPFLNQIVTGAANLDLDGNTRPLSKKLIVSLLQRLDVISAQEVRQYMHNTLRQCSQRHAQKIAQCLRVIETAAAPIAKTQWPAPPTYGIDPCGREICSVCARSGTEVRDSDTQSHDHADGDFAVEIDYWSDSD